jgi:nucleoside 2-deoxyribosyltransferase
MSNSTCVLCGRPADNTYIGGKDSYICHCDTCGHYQSSGFEDLELKELPPNERAMLSAFTKNLFEHGQSADFNNPHTDTLLKEIIARYKNMSLKDKIDNLIFYIGDHSTYFGEKIPIIFRTDYPITYSINEEEFKNILRQCEELNYLITQEMKTKLLIKGWDIFDALKMNRDSKISNKCFVAMACANKECYEKAIKPAIEELQYKPIFIESMEHNEKICDLIIAEIRNCRFLIADVTGQRQNVYYEAGYAQGIGRDVIWTVKKDELEKVHFDVRQYSYIDWANYEDLRIRLISRIRATIL